MVAAGFLPYTVEYDKDIFFSPRLFCSVLEMSMANWRDEMQHLGLDLCDGGRSLLDLRFAENILILGTDYYLIGVILGKLVKNPCRCGITLVCTEN